MLGAAALQDLIDAMIFPFRFYLAGLEQLGHTNLHSQITNKSQQLSAYKLSTG
jgi:hypothetical protein